MLNSTVSTFDAMKVLVSNGMFNGAVGKITAEADPNTAPKYYTFLFNNFNLQLWKAFLNNQRLKYYLNGDRLKKLLNFLCFGLSNRLLPEPQREIFSSFVLLLTQTKYLSESIKKTFSLEDKVGFIEDFLNLKFDQIAEQWIAEEEDLKIVVLLHEEIFQHFNPVVIRGCLKNKRFQPNFMVHELKWIISEALARLQDEVDKDTYHDILVLIAQNENWCRMLSYPHFINTAKFSPKLATYITSTGSFVTHLEPYHIGLLAQEFPEKQEQLLRMLVAVMNDNKDKIFWGAMALQRVFHVSQEKLFIGSNTAYRSLVDVYVDLFRNNRFFAIEVLKNPYLARNLFYQRLLFACNHPLLTQDDFKELSQYYFERDEFVSNAYACLLGQLECKRAAILSVEELVLAYEIAYIRTENFSSCYNSSDSEEDLFQSFNNFLIGEPDIYSEKYFNIVSVEKSEVKTTPVKEKGLSL